MSYDDIPVDEFFKLRKNPPHNKRVRLYNDKGKRVKPVTNPNKPKYSLKKLGPTVDKLVTTVDKLVTTVDKMSITLNQLADTMVKGFARLDQRIDSVEQRMDTGFKQVNDRLDYVVTANNLKDLPQKK